jgi:hypothetical protein
VSVTNASIVSDTYQIAVTGNTWGVNVPTNIGPILSGASQSFDIDVAIPAGAIPGASDIATVTVSSQGDGDETTSVLIGTFVGQFRQVSLAPTSMTKYGISAHFVNYAIEVTNTGVWQDRFSISVSGAHWPTGGFPNPTGLLQPGAKQIIPVTVYIPPGQAINSSDSATLRVSSVGDPRVWSESVLTTVVTDAYKVYLPKTQR